MDQPSSSCPTCGHRLGPKLVDCPYRADGGCPLEAATSLPGSKTNTGCMVGVLLFLVVWLGGATLGFTSMLIDSRSIISSLLSLGALAIFWAFGLFGLAFVLFAIFGKNITLYNAQTGAMGITNLSANEMLTLLRPPGCRC